MRFIPPITRTLIVPLIALLCLPAITLGTRVYSPSSITVNKGKTATLHVRDTGTICLSPFIAVTQLDTSMLAISPWSSSAKGDLDFSITGKKVGKTSLKILSYDCNGGPLHYVMDTIPVFVVDVPIVPPWLFDRGPISDGNTPNAGQSNDPVNTSTGELHFVAPPDIALGGPMGLSFSRAYFAHLKRDGNIVSALGTNWLHTYDAHCVRSGDTMTIVNSMGRLIWFLLQGGSWILQGNRETPYQLAACDTEYLLGNPKSGFIAAFDTSGRLLRYEDGHGNALTMSYTAGKLTSVDDGLGRSLTLAYNTRGLLASVSDGARMVQFGHTASELTSVKNAAGHITTYTYTDTSQALLRFSTLPLGNVHVEQTFDVTGRVATQTDAMGNAWTFTYAAATTITDPLHNATAHTNSSAHTITRYTDEFGRSTGIDNDTLGRRMYIIDRLGDTTIITYHDSSGNVASVRNADGTQTTYTYARRTRCGLVLYDLVRITAPDGNMDQYAYDASGNVVLHKDRNGNEWKYVYNTRGQVLADTLPTGAVRTNTYDAAGRLAASTDYSGNTTHYTYDTADNLILTTYADTTSVGATYDALNRMLTATDELGRQRQFFYDVNSNLARTIGVISNTTLFAYDAMDRVIQRTDALGNRRSWTYDSLGRMASSTDERGNTVQYLYDLHGTQTGVRDAAGKVWSRTVDAETVPTSARDPLGNTAQRTTDKMGRPIRQISPIGRVWSTERDVIGRPTTITNPLGNQTAYQYDPRGLVMAEYGPEDIRAGYQYNQLMELTSSKDPNGNDWLSAYDAAGRKISDADPLGHVTTYRYNNRNRLASIVYPTGDSLVITYDATGMATELAYSASPDLHFTRDSASRLTAAEGITFAWDKLGQMVNSNGLTISRLANGLIVSITYATGKTVTYAYDVRNLLTTITDWLGGTTAFTHDDAGKLLTITRPNTINTTYQYDNDGNVLSIVEQSAQSATSTSSITLSRDSAAQIIGATRTGMLDARPLTQSVTMQYNAASDPIDAACDERGRVTHQGQTLLVWDGASCLGTITEFDKVPVHFTYDAAGNVLMRTHDTDTSTFTWNYALGLPSISIDRSSGNTRYNIHTPGGTLLYVIDSATNARYDYHFDERGATLMITNSAGNAVNRYAYTPYGVITAETTSIANMYTYGGAFGVIEEMPELYRMRARVYDAYKGRMLTR